MQTSNCTIVIVFSSNYVVDPDIPQYIFQHFEVMLELLVYLEMVRVGVKLLNNHATELV